MFTIGAPPRLTTVPFMIALEPVTELAGSVVTTGKPTGQALVVNGMFKPYPVPAVLVAQKRKLYAVPQVRPESVRVYGPGPPNVPLPDWVTDGSEPVVVVTVGLYQNPIVVAFGTSDTMLPLKVTLVVVMAVAETVVTTGIVGVIGHGNVVNDNIEP